MAWSGELEDFAPWLEEETVAVERALNLLKALRVGPRDVYAVANGRIRAGLQLTTNIPRTIFAASIPESAFPVDTFRSG